MVNPKELKEYAKGEELDAQFKKYHDQYFEKYDCNQCRNMVEKCKPESCKGFPYTKEDNRKESLLGILSNLSICPVVYEIYNQLKKDYQFTYEK